VEILGLTTTRAGRWALALLAGAILPMAAASARAEGADPAFTRSGILDAPAVIVAGQAFTIGLRVRNDGDTTHYTRVTFAIPVDLFLAEPLPPDCFARFDAESRQLLYEGPIDGGQDWHCESRLIALPDASTHASFALNIQTPPDRWAGDTIGIEIVTPPAPAMITLTNGWGISRAGVLVLTFLGLWLVAAGLAWATTSEDADATALLSRRLRAVSATSGAFVGIGFLMLFGVMAWEDWRVLSTYRETRCEIVDANFKHARASQTTRADGRPVEARFKPVFSLRHASDGESHHALGFSTDSRLSYTTGEVAALLAAHRHGDAATCWVDPEDPGKVVLARGFGGAYLFLPLPILLIALAIWFHPGTRSRPTR